MTRDAVEIERSGLRDSRRVGHAQDLEVVIFIQPVACYRFGEAQGDIILNGQNAVGGLRLAKQHRRTGIFRSADDRRRFGHESRAIPAERHGTQVVFQLFRILFAVEAERHDPSVLNHRFVARSEGIQAVLRKERTLVHPGVIVLRGEFVLELDMVEVLMMNIKAINRHRQVITDGVLG